MTTMMKPSILLVALLVATCQAFVAHPRLGHHAASSTTITSLGMGLLNRFRKRRQVEGQPKDPIAVGSVLPDVDVERFVGGSAQGDAGVATATAQAVSILEAVKTNDKALLIGMPGAL